MSSRPHRVELSIGADHPSYAGHFPGRPILPGVVLLAELLECMGRDAATRACLGDAPKLNTAKSVAPVRPGQRLQARWSLPATGNRLPFEVRTWLDADADEATGPVVASGQWEGTAAASGGAAPVAPADAGAPQ